jgi:hypothetical protein
MPDQLAEHEACRVGSDCKADALSAHDHRGVDADDLAVGRNERSAGIAGIERGVGLDQIVDEAAGARAQRTAERGHDTRRHRRFETERIADGDHQLAALQLLGIAERRRRQRHRFVDAQQREVGVGIIAHQPRAQILAVGGGHLDARTGAGRVRDVAVGENEPVGSDNDS